MGNSAYNQAMAITHTITVSAPSQTIFDIYKDIESWPQWDPDLEAVGLDGTFSIGATGWIKPKGAPRSKTRITELIEPESFTVESRLPMCRIVFRHELSHLETSTRVTHTVDFTGLLGPLFSTIIGRKIRQGMEGSMQGLKSYAERQTHA